MKLLTSALAALTAGSLLCTALAIPSAQGTASLTAQAAASESIEDQMDWSTVEIGGGGFVSGIVTGKETMLARTDVGGAYKYNYDTGRWEQLLAFLNESDRGLLSISGICIDPTDDDTFYLLAGCAYFSDARTEIFKTTDGGKTFTRSDVTDLIQVHANGAGRQCGEPIAVDPDNPDIIYAGGDVASGGSALIKSTDGGKTWNAVSGYDDLGLYTNTIKWPTWTEHTVRAVTSDEYSAQNGVATICVLDGKVYVGTSAKAEGNFAVADVETDQFETLSSDLPTDSFPSRITLDADGNLLICYVGTLTFGSSGGGIYRYNPTADTVTNISPTGNSFGACVSQPDNADCLIATTCGVWSWQYWDDDTHADGEWMYRSTDGGTTWTTIYPGEKGEWTWSEEKGSYQEDLYKPLQDGGYSWVYGKAIHWSGSLVLNPKDSSQLFVTSGNGVFEWDNIWPVDGVDDPVATFHPNGIEEVVALDMVSVPGGAAYSAIGDYDGFIHTDTTVSGTQYQPNMGSTCAIAYCPQNPDVMIRIAEHESSGMEPGYYSLDGGKTWTAMANSPGGHAAITELADGSYRFFKSASSSDNSTAVYYSDDYGQTWSTCSGIPSVYGSKPTYLYVDPDQAGLVYAYATYYNSSWYYSKSSPDLSDAKYVLCVSTDYGATFTSTDVCMYDQCDSAGRIAALGNGDLILGAGWYGAYRVSDNGATIEKLDSVYYCKTMGYGAAKEEGGLYTLYLYGQPTASDPEGVYRSTDGGETWVCINTENLYGGTGNGNFLVGDMNEFGKVYMSTVGCGIVVGSVSDETPDPKPTTTTTTATTTTTTTTTTATTTSTDKTTSATKLTTTTSGKNTTTTTTTTASGVTTTTTSGSTEDGVLIGDINLDGGVSLADLVIFQKQQRGAIDFNAQQTLNADCDQTDDSGITSGDVTALLQWLIGSVETLPVQ